MSLLTKLSNRKAIIATSNPYIPQLMGGSERSSEAIASHLSKQGFHVSVICSLEPNGWIGNWNRLRRKAFRMPFPKDTVGNADVFRCWAEDGSIEKHIEPFVEANGADIALVQAGYSFSIARKFHQLGVPTLVFIRDVEFNPKDGTPLADNRIRYIANSQFTAQRVKERFGLNVNAVVPPAVDPDLYRTQRSPEYVLMVNPVRKKGVEIVLELARRRPDIPFVLLESWILDEYSKRQLAADLKKMANVTFLSRQTDIRPIYAKAKILLAPSVWEEAWGRVATEAQANGIPVIAASVGGLPESVGPGGILISKDAGIDEWLNVLSHVWDMPARLDELSAEALKHSMRPEVQPDYLFTQIDGEIAELLQC